MKIWDIFSLEICQLIGFGIIFKLTYFQIINLFSMFGIIKQIRT
jgi:hypothetical protein